RLIGRKIWVFPQTTAENSLAMLKSGSRCAGSITSWVPYCTSGQSASATTPTSKIWQRRSLAHSLRTIDSIERPLLSRFTPPIHHRDQENKNDSFSRCNPKRGWRADG